MAFPSRLWPPFAELSLVLALTMIGCGAAPESAPNATGGASLATPNGGGDDVSCPTPARRACRMTVGVHDGVTDCVPATQLCNRGAWGACGDPTTFCSSDAVEATLSLSVLAGPSSPSAWNASPPNVDVRVEGTKQSARTLRFTGKNGDSFALIDRGSGGGVAFALDVEPRDLTLVGGAASDAFVLRVHEPGLDFEASVTDLSAVVQLDAGCSTIAQLDLSFFVAADGVRPDVAKLFGAPTSSEGGRPGWSFSLSSVAPTG